MESVRLHPDIFTKKEAAEYLRLESERCIDAIERDFRLVAYKFGRQRVYYRPDLDACALRMMGKDVAEQPKMRMAGGSR